jgi:hypothetical protein
MGSVHQTIYMPDIARFTTPLPTMSEQLAIVRFIRGAVTALLRAEDLVATQIDRLREYRQALISGAVTGQIDVSSEAA